MIFASLFPGAAELAAASLVGGLLSAYWSGSPRLIAARRCVLWLLAAVLTGNAVVISIIAAP